MERIQPEKQKVAKVVVQKLFARNRPYPRRSENDVRSSVVLRQTTLYFHFPDFTENHRRSAAAANL